MQTQSPYVLIFNTSFSPNICLRRLKCKRRAFRIANSLNLILRLPQTRNIATIVVTDKPINTGMNQKAITVEVTSIINPIPQKASAGVRKHRVSGETITSLIPVIIRTRLMATIIEMMKIVPIISLAA